MVGSPTVLLFVAEINPNDGCALLLLKVCEVVAPNIWTRYAMANDVNQEKVLAQTLTNIRIESRRLAWSSGEKDSQPIAQVLLHLTEHCVHVTLHILAAFELVALLLGGGTLVDNTEVVGIAGTIYHAALLQYIVGYGNESSTATARLNLIHILMSSCISQWPRKIEARVVVVVEGADLIAKAAVNALGLVNLWIEEAKSVGLHAYGVVSAYTGTSSTSTTVCWICNLYHFISFTFLRDMVRTKVRMNTMMGAVKS